MNTFKKWLEFNFSGVSMGANSGPEIEHDPFVPDQSHVQHAINISKKIKGFFPAFRSSVKNQAVLQSFHNNLKNVRNPFNYKKSNWLNDEIQQNIADEVGVEFNQVEPYCEPLKRQFVQMYNNSGGDHPQQAWDYSQQSQSWPGAGH